MEPTLGGGDDRLLGDSSGWTLKRLVHLLLEGDGLIGQPRGTPCFDTLSVSGLVAWSDVHRLMVLAHHRDITALIVMVQCCLAHFR